MCLITNQKTYRIASEDIVTYKALYKNKNVISSIYKTEFVYELGKEMQTVMKKVLDRTPADHFVGDWISVNFDSVYNGKMISIGPGFHSATIKKRALYHTCGRNSHVFKCLIPKGARYYEDGTGLIVSNRIVIVKRLYRSKNT